MSDALASLPARNDTLLGVCEGLGEEFGFHPNYLRVLLGALLLWNPVAVIGGYLAIGAVLALGRWLVPVRRAAAVEAAPATPVAQNDAAAAAPLADAA